VDLPLIASLDRSNATQIAEAARMVKATGARKVAVLGLAFKPGTDDLRESPILEVMADLLEQGIEIVAHDPAITARPGSRRNWPMSPMPRKGLGQLATGLRDMLAEDAATASPRPMR
jgi:GDP-mannose 6-dehydrogenase